MTSFATQSNIQMTAPGIIGRTVAGVGRSKLLTTAELRELLGTGSTGGGDKYLADDNTWKTIDTSGYLPLSGGTLTGQLTMPYGDSTNPSILIGNTNTGIHGLNGASRRIRFTIGGTLSAEYFAGGHFIDGTLQFGTIGSSANTGLLSPAAAILEVRQIYANTTAQTLRLNNTYTSDTSFESLQFKAVTGGAYQIGSAVGSAGGTNRAITFGHWNAAGTFVGTASITAGTNGGRFSDTGGQAEGAERFGESSGTSYQSLAVGGYAQATAQYGTAVGRCAYAGQFCTSLGRNAGTTGTNGGFPTAHPYLYCITVSDGGDNYFPTASNQFMVAGAYTEAFFGKGVVSASPSNVRFQTSGGSGTNIAGANFTLAGGRGTGSGVGGSLIFQTAPAGSAGTSANSLVTRLTIDSAGASTFAGDLLFTDATYDIGKSGATRPRDGFFSRNLRVESTITTANVTSNGVAGDLNLSPTSSGGTASIAMCQNGFVYQRFMPTMGFIQGAGQFIGWDSSSWSTGTSPDLALYRDAAGILSQRNNTNAQTFRVAETWTSSTSFGAFQIKANAGAAYQIGSVVGSAGGTNRHMDFGRWNAAGAWTSLLTWDSNNTLTSTVGFQVSGELNMIRCQNSGFGSEQDGAGLIIYSNGWQAWPSRTSFHSRTGQNANSGRTGFIHSTTHTNAAFNSFFDWRTAAPGELGTTSIMRLTFDGSLVLSQAPAAPGWGSSPTILNVIGAAHTALPAAVETTDINFNLARTVQFAAGALTTQRAFRIQAPTYAFVGASTITTASTLSISGPPVAGTNATITNAYALNVESGRSRLGGNLFVDGGTSTFGGGLVIGPFTGFGVSTDYIRADTSWSVEPHLLGYPWHFAWVDNVPKVTMQTVGGSHSGVRIASDCAISIVSTTNSKTGTPDVNLWRDAANVLAQRNSTNAQTFRLYGTHTSSTSYELLEIRGVSGANFEIGPENGSAGGTLRGLTLGGYSGGSSTITPWLTFDNTGIATFNTGNLTLTSNGTGLTIQNGHLWMDSWGTHSGLRSRRANGTIGSPTQILNGNLMGFYSVIGWHSGGAYHSTHAGFIGFYATENYTSTAQGCRMVLATTPNGTTTLTTALEISQSGICTFSKLVGQASAEITNTPTGTTQTITLNDGNHQTLSLVSATGAVAVTLTVPSNVASGTIIIRQDEATPKNITWAVSSGSIKWLGTQPTWASDAANSFRIVSWRWNGSILFLTSSASGL